MIRAAVVEARVFDSWNAIQEALVMAITPLTEEQMTRRLVPSLRSVGEIAEHIVYGRSLWLFHELGDEVAEVKPMLSWDKPNNLPRTAAEVVGGLNLTWQLLTATLMRGESTDDVPEDYVSILQTVWGLIDHDLPHAGELSLLLGAYGLPGVEI